MDQKSADIGVSIELKNPEYDRAKLGDLLDQAYARAKSKLLDAIIKPGQKGDTCTQHERVSFDKSSCPL